MNEAWESFKNNAYALMDATYLLIELEKIKPKWATASLLSRRSGVEKWKIDRVFNELVSEGKAQRSRTRDGRTVYRYLDKGEK